MKLTRVFLVVLLLIPMSLYADNGGGYQPPFDGGGQSSPTGCLRCVENGIVASCDSGPGPEQTYANCHGETVCYPTPGMMTYCEAFCAGSRCLWV